MQPKTKNYLILSIVGLVILGGILYNYSGEIKNKYSAYKQGKYDVCVNACKEQRTCTKLGKGLMTKCEEYSGDIMPCIAVCVDKYK
jgi:hypothetical protein